MAVVPPNCDPSIDSDCIQQKHIGLVCNEGSIYETQPGECSIARPSYCDGSTGNLVSDCERCECYEGTFCNEYGSCETETCGDVICSENHECINDRCVLQYTPYKLGLVYIYNTPETYNPDWEDEFKLILSKIESGLKAVSENKIDASIEIIGETQTDVFCWNPATVGVTIEYSNGLTGYNVLPGSDFSSTGTTLTGEIESIECDRCVVELVKKTVAGVGDKICNEGSANWETQPSQCNPNMKTFYCDGSTGDLIRDCQKCGCTEGTFCNEDGNCYSNEDIKQYLIRIDCEDGLSYHNLFETNKSQVLRDELSQNLNFDFDDYDGVFVIFGKLGNVLPENDRNIEWVCSGSHAVIGGYSSLIMAENSIKAGGLFPCNRVGKTSFYIKTGWHILVHEILHRFGAVDVYDTGTVFGIKTYRDKALTLDSRTDESIMGNSDRDCIDEGGYERDGNICTTEELEYIYLDKLNRQKIGIE